MSTVEEQLVGVNEWVTHVGRVRALLVHRLLANADKEIKARAAEVYMGPLRVIVANGLIENVTTRTENGWFPTLTLDLARPRHRCTCPDWAHRHHACKHIVALGELFAKRLEEQETAGIADLVDLGKEVEKLRLRIATGLESLRRGLGDIRVRPTEEHSDSP